MTKRQTRKGRVHQLVEDARRGPRTARAKQRLHELEAMSQSLFAGTAARIADEVSRLIDQLADALSYAREVGELGDHLDITEIRRFIDPLVDPAHKVGASGLFLQSKPRGGADRVRGRKDGAE